MAPGGRAARLALPAILGLAALLRLWQLDQNGYGRLYYAAGVRSMLGSAHAFLFNAFDPAGFVSIDKPPLALWLQVASAKLLGFGAFSVMLPQVLEGLAAVALVHCIVARRAGTAAGLLAALFLALTPIVVAVDRSNNTDSCLVMVLLLAAWALLRAAETGGGRWLLLALALVGVGFNVKMAAAWVVVPGFVAVYLGAATGLPLRRRLAGLAAALALMLAVSLSWVAAFDLTPPAQRPYAGSTTHNSMLELALLHNGVDRFLPRRAAEASAPAVAPAATASAPALWDRTPVGALRLATPHLAGQMGWWLPLALAGVVLGGWPWRRGLRLAPAQAHVALWAGWALGYGLAFSFAGGVFHTYYTAVLGAPLAALAGVGASALWQRRRTGSWPWLLSLLLLATALWQAWIELGALGWHHDDWRSALAAAVVALAVPAAAACAAPRWRPLAGGPAAALALCALAPLLALPAAWALSTVLFRPNVAAPAADILAWSTAAADAETSAAPRPRARRLLEFLRRHRGSERYLLAVPNALQAAPLIVRSGESVMAMGGYLGRDPILTPADLERLVAAGEVRYAILGGAALVPPDSRAERALAHWIRSHGRRVDPALWRETPDAAPRAGAATPRLGGPVRLYDLRPDEPLPATSDDAN